MIEVNLIWAMTGFFCAGMVVVFTVWAVYSFNESSKGVDGGEHIEQCPYCTYVFFAAAGKDGIRCPRCKSFLTQLPQRTGDVS